LQQGSNGRMSLGGKGGIPEGVPDLEGLKVSGETADILAKKAGGRKQPEGGREKRTKWC